MTSVKELLNKVQEVLVKQTNPLAIILFGSYSRNTQNVDSDIDIAIKAEKLDRKMLFNLKQELEDIQEKWNKKYDILAYYIEHDELEKVETQLIAINANIKVQDYDKTIEELEKCKFILEHIKDKDSLKLVNIF